MTTNDLSIFSSPCFIWQNLEGISFPARDEPASSDLLIEDLHENKRDWGSCANSHDSQDVWNAFYVKLPCSPKNLLFEKGNPVSCWEVIIRILSRPINCVEDLARAVLSYNPDFANSWNFGHLSTALELEPGYTGLLSKIAELALKLPSLISEPIPLLKRNKESSLSLSQPQIACLIANAFFCTFPHRNTRSTGSEYSNFPFINFGVFMSRGFRNQTKSTSQKILCILHYFSRVLSEDPPTGTVTFTRRCLNNPPDFASSDVKFSSISFGVSSTCLIEDAHPNTIKVSFANRFLGGGVLRGGCVQEEILCCICPEILAGLLFVEALENHESLIIEGAERFSRYTGYGQTFKWAGDFNEAIDAKNKRDADGRWKGVVVAIDALICSRGVPQFEVRSIQREVNKAFCGFNDLLIPHRNLPNVVVSGHWGCGCFGGDKELKCLIQMMACAQAGKSLAYCSFLDEDFAERALQVFQILCSNSCTVAQLWKIITSINHKGHTTPVPSVFRIVHEQVLHMKPPL